MTEKITVKEYQYLEDPGENRERAVARLDDIVHILREKCPWDREQTHQSLEKGMIEEAYEVVEAIRRKDAVNLKEELGDVLLQVIFHSILSEEERCFDLTDVINEECDKMIRRHPHVFLDEEVKTVDKVLEKWENIKQKEHQNRTAAEQLSDVPKALPALMRSGKVQKKASKAGWQDENRQNALSNMVKETKKWIEACDGAASEKAMETLGDMLFSIVNVARLMGLDAEQALHRATDQFIMRFGENSEPEIR